MPKYWELVKTMLDLDQIELIALYRRVDGFGMKVPANQQKEDIYDRLRDCDKRNPLWG